MNPIYKKSVIIPAYVILFTFFCSMWTSAQLSVEDYTPCGYLNLILQEEVVKYSKTVPGDNHIRYIGMQEKDVFTHVLKLCAKLNAREKKVENNERVYELSHGAGLLVVQEIYDKELFVTILIVSDCPDIPVAEIRYVPLRRYNSL